MEFLTNYIKCLLSIFKRINYVLLFQNKTYSKQKTLSKLLGFLKERRRTELFEHGVPIKQRSLPFSRQASQKKGDDILSHITAVPSAQAGLTSLFGMGRGEPRRRNHLKIVAPSNSPKGDS